MTDDLPRQASLRRVQRFSVRPNRELGQNFLIDDNILRVIGRLAELAPDDVVLEVGGGVGVLSEFIAPQVRHLHVVEVDRQLEPPLADALAAHANTSLHIADATRANFSALAPPPTKLVANLPYGVAATVVLKAIDELPDARRFVAMVQREVAERLAAAPGSRTYGVTSVLAQLSCEVRIDRRVSGSVFHPVPNVDSALIVLSRTAGAPSAQLRALVHAAFGHRRKTLAGSLALTASAAGDLREATRAALVAIGHRPDARAEKLSPSDFRALADALGDGRLAALL